MPFPLASRAPLLTLRLVSRVGLMPFPVEVCAPSMLLSLVTSVALPSRPREGRGRRVSLPIDVGALRTSPSLVPRGRLAPLPLATLMWSMPRPLTFGLGGGAGGRDDPGGVGCRVGLQGSAA